MTTSNNIADYPILTNPSLWNLSPTNTKYVQNFILYQRAKGIKLFSIENYVKLLVLFMKRLGLEDSLQAVPEDILRVFVDLEDSHTPATISNYNIVTKMFYRRYKTKEELDALFPFKRKPLVNTHEISDYLTVEDVKKMRDYAEAQGDPRGMALIMMLFGTGARVSELLDANIEDVEIRQYNGIISVDGKTGKRRIPFVIGLPEITTWINAHPLRENKHAPLFVTYNTRGNGIQRLSSKRIENYLIRMKKAVGIPDNVKCNPHAFRHLLATTMSHKLSLREMNRLFGWSDSSHTVLTYLHTSDEDLENSILSCNGIQKKEEVKEKPAMFVQCPSCNAILPPGAVQCPKCRMILDPVLAVQLSNIAEDMGKRELLQEYFDK